MKNDLQKLSIDELCEDNGNGIDIDIDIYIDDFCLGFDPVALGLCFLSKDIAKGQD